MTPDHSLITDSNNKHIQSILLVKEQKQSSWKFLVGALFVASVVAFLSTYLFKDRIIRYLRSTQSTIVLSDPARSLPGIETENKWHDTAIAGNIEDVTDLTTSQMLNSETTEKHNLVVAADPATSAIQTQRLADFTSLSIVLISLKPERYILLSNNRRYQPGEPIFDGKYELADISADTLTLSTGNEAISVALK